MKSLVYWRIKCNYSLTPTNELDWILFRVPLKTQAVTGICLAIKSGSMSTPMPGPEGTVTTPSSLSREEVSQVCGMSLLNPLNSW